MPANDDSKQLKAKDQTGGTGAIPFIGEAHGHEFPASPHLNESQSYDQFRSQFDEEVVAIMHGGTGGIGRIPETLEEVKAQKITPVDFLDEIRTGEFKNLPLDDKFKKIVETKDGFKPVIASAQSQMATVALTLGAMANITQIQTCAEKGGPKGWTRFRMERLDPHIHPSTLKLYMNAASLNDAVEYLPMGIDRLGKIALAVKDCHLENEPKPTRKFMELLGGDFSDNMPIEEFKDNCDAAILRFRLNRESLETPFQTLRMVCGAGIKIEKVDIDEMKYRRDNNQDPVQYLLDLADEPENRQDLLTHKHRGNKASTSNPRAQRPKDINVAVQQLKETVIDINKLDAFETPVEIDRIDALIAQLQILKQKEEARRQAKSQAA